MLDAPTSILHSPFIIIFVQIFRNVAPETFHSQGTRDFSPLEMVRRNYFRYYPESVPAFRVSAYRNACHGKSSTLLGKYGEEGDKLLFKILNSGNFLENRESSIEHRASRIEDGRQRTEDGKTGGEHRASSIEQRASGAETN